LPDAGQGWPGRPGFSCGPGTRVASSVGACAAEMSSSSRGSGVGRSTNEPGRSIPTSAILPTQRLDLRLWKKTVKRRTSA
jgi:hypothetical protein